VVVATLTSGRVLSWPSEDVSVTLIGSWGTGIFWPAGQNGSRERGFESLKYERLYLHEIADGLDLAQHAEDYRAEYNTIRPHEALSWNSPLDVHLGRVDPTTLNFPAAEILPTP